jgi:hypothetical protein
MYRTLVREYRVGGITSIEQGTWSRVDSRTSMYITKKTLKMQIEEIN